MSDGASDSDKGLLYSAVLVAAVSAILLAGFMLKVDPGAAARARTPSTAPPPPPLALGSTVAAEPQPALAAPESSGLPMPSPDTVAPPPAAAEPAPAAEPLVVKLATRVDRDRGRLSQAGGRFTAQLLVACKPENVDRFLAASGSPANLYVLPARVKDEACFRVCYGTYATLQEASSAADLPKGLRGKEKIAAVEIAKVLP